MRCVENKEVKLLLKKDFSKEVKKIALE